MSLAVYKNTNRAPLPTTVTAGPVVLFLVVAINVLIPAGTLDSAPSGKYYTQILTALLLIAAWAKTQRDRTRAPGSTLLIWYTAVVTVSSLFADGTQIFYLLALPFVVLQYSAVWRSSESVKITLSKLIVALGVAEALLALLEFSRNTGPLIGPKVIDERTNFLFPTHFRAQGTLGHPLALSAILLAAFTCLLASDHFSKRAKILVGIVLTAGAITTGSATTVILGGIAVVVSLVVTKHAGKALMAAVALFVCLAFYASRTVVWQRIIDKVSGTNSLQRQNSVFSVPRLLMDQDYLSTLFGTGLNGAQKLYENGILPNTGFHAVDNQFVSALISGGVVALALLLAAHVVLVKSARNSKCALLLICLLMLGWSFDYLYWYGPALTVFTVVALLVKPRAVAKSPGQAASDEDAKTAARA